MNIKSIKKMLSVSKAKGIFFGFVFILTFSFIFFNGVKVSAVNVQAGVDVEIISTQFDKNNDTVLDYDDTESFDSVNLTHDGQSLTFVEGNGTEMGIKFKLTGFPSGITAFVVMENNYSDASTNADMDKYKKNASGEWCIETGTADNIVCSNSRTEGLYTSKAEFSVDATSGKTIATINYRLRDGGYGLKFFKVFYFTGEVSQTSSYTETTIVFAIAKPIDMVEQGTACNAPSDDCSGNAGKIYTNYKPLADGASTRVARELKIYIPGNVAYNYRVISLDSAFDSDPDVNTDVVTNFANVQTGTIYAINYFNETAAAIVPSDEAGANRAYLYTNFTFSGKDSNKVTENYITEISGSKNYTDFLNSFTSSEVDYITTSVDSIGRYHYYIKDIFDNVKVITQDVLDVKNRAIIVDVQKGNASEEGYGADETFTNESVKVTLTMTVETHFEVGVCLDATKCTKITNLDSSNVRKIKYWRVNITTGDPDAYDATKVASDPYASQDHAAAGSMYNLYCGSGASDCSSYQQYDESLKNSVDGHGSKLDEFVGNKFVMYIATNGRYRFWIEDTSGNNTEGTASDPTEGEYRNPRVEVYAIDKAAPEITFEKETNVDNPNEITVGGTTIKMFDIETCKYYQGLELLSSANIGDGTDINCGDTYLYDATVSDITDTAPITTMIYYPLNREDGRSNDVFFTDAMAILLAKVRVSEKQYYYTAMTPTLFADYSDYDRATDKYKTYGVVNNITTIASNMKHNSNGLKNGASFNFVEINYYHNNGTSLICAPLESINGYTDEMTCVNYYIDHGVDFIIEFKAEDSVGNIGVNRIYVNMVDKTPPGFSLHDDGDGNVDNTKLIKRTNISDEDHSCRMEIGQEIGAGMTQNYFDLLHCYNINLGDVDNEDGYNFEDNMYNGLAPWDPSHVIATKSHVKLYMVGDDGADINLEEDTFIPNKTGFYDLKIVIDDGNGNELTVVVSYYVDRKIVLIEPLVNDKFYGQADPTFAYCVYIDIGNHYDIRFSSNPYSDPTIFTKIYCSNDDASDIEVGKELLFRSNDSGFYGNLSRLESSWYNLGKNTKVDGTSEGVENNYVGLYRIILGTLNIFVDSASIDPETDAADDDYIVKIHPNVRDNTKYSQSGSPTENDNLITNDILNDDDKLSQSSVNFTIKQILLNVSASGGNKNYGETDTEWGNYNNDAENKYLNGFKEDVSTAVFNTINDGKQYKDSVSIILGVLRRENGENVGSYDICNYRDTGLEDVVLESVNDVYVGCDYSYDVSFDDPDDFVYTDGILSVGANYAKYVKSRALYIKPNKEVAGRTLNTTPHDRDNNHANYVIVYTGADYKINAIDLVVQAAPGQRREYNYAGVVNPDPWEIILYGLVDGNIKKDSSEFNGYTDTILVDAEGEDSIDADYSLEDGSYYETAKANDSTAAALIAANASETRSNWYFYHNGTQLEGYKTNESYYLLRSTNKTTSDPTAAGSAKLVRESGNTGGWYLYYSLDTDLNVVSGTHSATASEIAVVTNGKGNCSYDATGHIVTVGGTADCKNYNLIYNPYYTDADGYTIDTKPAGSVVDGNGIYQAYVYRSNGKTCLELDPDIPCTNVTGDDKKIYKNHFEIYRREIILEFNSALETVVVSGSADYNIFYGKRYDYYKTNLFEYDINHGEGYLFLCYQNQDAAGWTPADLANGGCTSDGSYGLTSGDTWENIGIYFKMHEYVSDAGSDYYATDSDKAIPAGAYYIYSDIKEEEKRNYNYKYQGGTLTIKSLPVEVVITSYAKEYGEKYYNKYGSGNSLSTFNDLDQCLLDGYFLANNDTLIDLRPGGTGATVYCGGVGIDDANKEAVSFGFSINGLDSLDDIISNFTGRAKRDRSVTTAGDVNGLQDNVGTYTLSQGTIHSKLNNVFKSNEYESGKTTSCDAQITKGSYGDCVVKSTVSLNNYVVQGENIVYSFILKGKAEAVDSALTIDVPEVEVGYLLITPAQLTITVTGGQQKMYGCAYNVLNTSNTSSYAYNTGYSDCVEEDDDYYDLGYAYTVSGDKDYQIAKNNYNYTSNDSYTVSGIYGSSTFRPTVTDYKGIKQYALNEGNLYRIPWDTYFNAGAGATDGVKMSAYVTASIKAQKTSATNPTKSYQGQTVGKYVITLGDVDATYNEAKATYVNACDKDNNPAIGGGYICKNYNIDYYGTSAHEDTASEVAQKFDDGSGNYPSALTFEITKRKAYVYTDYTQKIYGEADIYSSSTNAAIYMCGDYNMDGRVNDDDKHPTEGIYLDVYYGFCSQADVDANTDLDGATMKIVDYGLNRYYTKYNSLAKYPWNGLADSGIARNDYQTDVVSGQLSREGMGGNAPSTDDARGFYKFVYEHNDDRLDNVALTSGYGDVNYDVNFYNNDTDKLAVNVDGNITTTYNSETVDVKYEIVFRKVKIGFTSFDKVYGEHDDITMYNILVCAPSETFDFENMLCINGDAADKHGLSATHKTMYVDATTHMLKQSDFKNDFIVRIIRVLGENVSCGTASDVSVTLSGYFSGSGASADGLTYTRTLKCDNTSVDDKSVYETLAYIDQSDIVYPGYNYQVDYTIGYVNITPRPIIITPDAGQGFMYGDYDDILIPAITYTDSVVSGTGINQTYGLVHGSGDEGICLRNINYYNKVITSADDRVNKENGGCFNINDRKDEYKNNYTSKHAESASVNSDTGISSLTNKVYVFLDKYSNEEGTERSALNRTFNTVTVTSERYNRNVGEYTITLGDLTDKSGNYTLALATGTYTYTITKAKIDLTPDAKDQSGTTTGTTQEGQYKIYGEQDKELTFTLITTYTVSKTHYAKNNSNIVKVCDASNNCTDASGLVKYTYNSASDEFVEDNVSGTYIKLEATHKVVLNGFAYDENSGTGNHLDYGKMQTERKAGVEDATVNQGGVSGSVYYDKVCNNKPGDVGCNVVSGLQELSYGATSRILLGYLYVDGYAQATGVYNIVSGFKVAVNKWNNVNYDLEVATGVKFTIIPRPIGVQIANVEKTYGQTTDNISCDGATCNVEEGILLSGNSYLKYNFEIVQFTGPEDKVKDVVGANKGLYVQNGTFANNLAVNASYTQNGVVETKDSNNLGVYISRDEKNISNETCLYSGDRFGLCEDVGTYYLRFYGYVNDTDSLTTDNYNSVYRPASPGYTGLTSSVEGFYYNSYFGYNPNYVVIVIDNDADESVVKSDQLFATSAPSTSRDASSGELLKATGTLTINKKSVAIVVNTRFAPEGGVIYSVGQNTRAPSLPVIDNSKEVDYNEFYGFGMTANRESAVGGTNSYAKVIWGDKPNQVRTGDKLTGELAYCNQIVTQAVYDEAWVDGYSNSDYSCSGNLKYEADRNSVITNLEGYVMIVRERDRLSITNSSSTNADSNYESSNYNTMFYPGALEIIEDAIKPVVEVNRENVYIEANAIGTYFYECVGQQGTTTYTDCNVDGTNYSIIGKTNDSQGDPILKWLTVDANKSLILKVELPTISTCGEGTYDCTTSAYYQKESGKGQTNFVTSGGILPGVNAGSLVYPFIMASSDNIVNDGPTTFEQMINTLVSWFGVTAYDQGEVRNGTNLDKVFDKYWYIIIEKEGTNGDFEINKVGKYKVHFYVMDNAGNVSEGKMPEGAQTNNDWDNVGTLHVIDTTKPVVGTVNLYNGKVECKEQFDCMIEDNWVVAEDTYVPLNTLLRYADDAGTYDPNGTYIDIGASSGLSQISTLDKYIRSTSGATVTYTKDTSAGAIHGRYIKIPAGNNARALKHYSWSNSSLGIYLTITGGADNSYTDVKWDNQGGVNWRILDNSQWGYYYSRDAGQTWRVYERGSMELALDVEGSREILIKAIDKGVKISSASAGNSTYTVKYYGVGTTPVQETMSMYTFADSSVNDDWLKDFDTNTSEYQETNKDVRFEKTALVGWNVSNKASEDETLSEKLSQMIYGKSKDDSGYKYYQDRATAYLDRSAPTIGFSEQNGSTMYVYEFGCATCTQTYKERYAGAQDSYTEITQNETPLPYDKNTSFVINRYIHSSGEYADTSKYPIVGNYNNLANEVLKQEAKHSGLGGDYAMSGSNTGTDIRNINPYDRRYVIYVFKESNLAVGEEALKGVYEYSAKIPTTSVTTATGYQDAENLIYDVINDDLSWYTTNGDYSYQIVYSAFDKAGNESIYISRGVLFLNLIPTIAVGGGGGGGAAAEEVEQIEENSYSLVIEQGKDINEVVEAVAVSAGRYSEFINQTVYHNGNLVVDNKKYKGGVYDGFTTSLPGVYEITYTARYMYYNEDGVGELMEANPIKLTITVEATPPVVESSQKVQSNHLIMVIFTMMSLMSIGAFALVSKKRKIK